VVQLRGDAEGCCQLLENLGQQLAGVLPDLGVEHAQRPFELADPGDGVGGRPGGDASPDQADTGTRVDPAGEGRGQGGRDVPQREDEVAGQVRT
jgi:hypothetical protein